MQVDYKIKEKNHKIHYIMHGYTFNSLYNT